MTLDELVGRKARSVLQTATAERRPSDAEANLPIELTPTAASQGDEILPALPEPAPSHPVHTTTSILNDLSRSLALLERAAADVERNCRKLRAAFDRLGPLV
jgi:hypothetical protein